MNNNVNCVSNSALALLLLRHLIKKAVMRQPEGHSENRQDKHAAIVTQTNETTQGSQSGHPSAVQSLQSFNLVAMKTSHNLC